MDMCSFNVEMYSTNRNNLQKMCDYFNAKYDYDNKEKSVWVEGYNGIEEPTEYHIGSDIFDCNAYISKDMKYGLYVAYGSGYCNYSSVSIITKRQDLKYSISLRNACKMLGVNVILNTENTDIGFKEHFVINGNGELVEEDYKMINGGLI